MTTPDILETLDYLDRASEALELLSMAALGLHAEGLKDEAAALRIGVNAVQDFLTEARAPLDVAANDLRAAAAKGGVA